MDLIIKPTEVCNFKCTFCSSTKISEDHASLLDLDYVFRFLERYPHTNTIILNGGDPLMVDPSYYWKIIDFLDEHDMPASLSFTTNLWPWFKKPEKWNDLFLHQRVGVATSFQFGNGRLKGDFTPFTVQDFWDVSDKFLDVIGYRPEFIAVISEENEDSVIKTVELAKEMGVVCKLNYAMASGEQSRPYQLSKMYQHYVRIWKSGLHPWEFNTQQMMNRLNGIRTICPQNRKCDEGIRAFNPEGDYYSCGAFGDDKDYPLDFYNEKQTILQDQVELQSMKNACWTCPMFEICNGCRKTIKDHKVHGMVEEHCLLMKNIADDILFANDKRAEVTPYVNEDYEIILKSSV